MANTIIQNTPAPRRQTTSGAVQLNLLMALIHYVCNLKDDAGNLLPIEQRGLGMCTACWRKRAFRINQILAALPPEHRQATTACSSRPVKTSGATLPSAWATGWPSSKTLWWTDYPQPRRGSAATAGPEALCLLCHYIRPGQRLPLPELPFSPWPSPPLRLRPAPRQERGLKVLVNFCLDEYCNIGYMEGISDVFNSVRGFNMSCQVVVQASASGRRSIRARTGESAQHLTTDPLYGL